MHEYYFMEVTDDRSLSETYATWADEIESTGILWIKLLNAVNMNHADALVLIF